jgi:hypothetical protein
MLPEGTTIAELSWSFNVKVYGERRTKADELEREWIYAGCPLPSSDVVRTSAFFISTASDVPTAGAVELVNGLFPARPREYAPPMRLYGKQLKIPYKGLAVLSHADNIATTCNNLRDWIYTSSRVLRGAKSVLGLPPENETDMFIDDANIANRLVLSGDGHSMIDGAVPIVGRCQPGACLIDSPIKWPFATSTTCYTAIPCNRGSCPNDSETAKV